MYNEKVFDEILFKGVVYAEMEEIKNTICKRIKENSILESPASVKDVIRLSLKQDFEWKRYFMLNDEWKINHPAIILGYCDVCSEFFGTITIEYKMAFSLTYDGQCIVDIIPVQKKIN